MVRLVHLEECLLIGIVFFSHIINIASRKYRYNTSNDLSTLFLNTIHY